MSYVSAALPEGARRTTYDVPGGPLAAVELRPAGAVGTALLVPGFSGSKEDFGPLLPLLVPGGRRIVALDLRGQYESAGPDDPAAYSVDALAGDVLAVVRLLEQPVHLLGHSFGGLVARAAALRDPGALASLTLMSSGPQALVGPRVDVLAFLPQVIAAGGMAAVADASAALAEADPAGAGSPPEVLEFLRQRWLASSPTGLMAMGDALRTEPDRVDALRATGLPVLVLHGADDDAWSPATQAEMAGRLGAAYAVVPGRHSPAVEAPEATALTLLRFWA
ncbi:MAG TPA: alpha/beta fold hydrolase [Mycobacteriales bacterium]|jgi:pimeloyl-ACP methyl ester carboxylesterase|nr:alpha/beta fold hydrolase [Mycobacteriales bacterium]